MTLSGLSVLIVDDHPVIIHGVASYCMNRPEIEIVNSVGDYRSALTATKKHKPHVVVLDISLGNLSGLDLLREIQKISTDIAIIIYTTHSKRNYIHRALKQGAKGYVLKGDPLEKLIEAIIQVVKGGLYLSTSLPGDILQDLLQQGATGGDELDKLTPRELEVANLLAQGLSIQSIGSTLYISPKTVRVHRTNIMKKLSCTQTHDLLLRLQEYFPRH